MTAPQPTYSALPPHHNPPLRQLGVARHHAALRQHLKQLWRPARVVVGFGVVWAALSWLGVPQSMPDLAHGGLEGLWFGAAFWWAWRLWQKRPPQSPASLDRQIERSAHLRHEPLAVLADRPALSSDSAAQAVWRAHQARTRAALGTLHEGAHPLAVLLGAAGALAVAGTGLALWHEAAPAQTAWLGVGVSRLAAGFVPGRDDETQPLATVRAWVQPPTWLPGPARYLESTPGATITLKGAPLPAGTHLEALVSGARSQPAFSGWGIGYAKAQNLGAGQWRLSAMLESNGVVALRSRGRTLGQWRFNVIPPQAPQVGWKKGAKPHPLGGATLVPWQVSDPLGVKKVWLVVRKAGQPTLYRFKVALLDLPPGHKAPLKKAQSTMVHLGATPLAGQQVTAWLEAEGLNGAKGRGAEATFTLNKPAPPPTDAVANGLLAIRRNGALGVESPGAIAENMVDLASHTPGSGLQLALLYSARHAEPSPQAGQLKVRSALGRAWHEAPLAYRQPLAAPAGSGGALADLTTTTVAVQGSPLPAATSETLFSLAHIAQDEAEGGPENALLMARFRALLAGARQALLAGAEGQAPTAKQAQRFHGRMEAITSSFKARLNFLVAHAPGGSFAMPSGPLSLEEMGPATETFLAGGERAKALALLAQLEAMAAGIRPAQPMDVMAMQAQQQARAEARRQNAALRHIIKRETKLLDSAQQRLAAARHAALEDSRPPEQLSSNEILRALGIAGVPGSATPSQPGAADQSEPDMIALNPTAGAAQADERLRDHGTQRALRMLTMVLSARTQQGDEKPLPGLVAAVEDMKTVLAAQAGRHDASTVVALKKVIADLTAARQQLHDRHRQHNQSGSSMEIFPPPPSPNPSQSPDKNQDKSKDGQQGPSMEGGQGAGGDGAADEDEEDRADSTSPQEERERQSRRTMRAHKKKQGAKPSDHGQREADQPSDTLALPGEDSHKQAHAVEKELRKRATDRTRPEGELEYLDQLLNSVRPFGSLDGAHNDTPAGPTAEGQGGTAAP
ncbi:DUF4175 family protein [Formicincola oecophyllae]|uniref:DUF4175 family protein n=1 Tax=Formicincola oecophyllae TaxID=2558361 RepID=UPI00143D027B|nr:DUF4175 family protein [Formicincola oecophyllae]